MYNRLVFYCGMGAGDIFESREFVKDIMSFIGANDYYYAHNKNPRMFFDIPKLKYLELTPDMGLRISSMKKSDNFYLNTWIGRDAKYVLTQAGCVIDENFRMFNDMLKEAGHGGLTKGIMDYIPDLDFSRMDTSTMDKFIEYHYGRKIVLICNGKVLSSQAENFDFSVPILTVAGNHKDIDFVVTSPINSYLENIYISAGITQTVGGFDLNEISYLAKFADVIIGRKSGPFTFAHNKDVWYSNKKSLSFTYAEHSSHFVQGNGLPLRKYWSPATTTVDIVKKIEEVLNG